MHGHGHGHGIFILATHPEGIWTTNCIESQPSFTQHPSADPTEGTRAVVTYFWWISNETKTKGYDDVFQKFLFFGAKVRAPFATGNPRHPSRFLAEQPGNNGPQIPSVHVNSIEPRLFKLLGRFYNALSPSLPGSTQTVTAILYFVARVSKIWPKCSEMSTTNPDLLFWLCFLHFANLSSHRPFPVRFRENLRLQTHYRMFTRIPCGVLKISQHVQKEPRLAGQSNHLDPPRL